MADFVPDIRRYIEKEIEVLRKLDVEELDRAVNAIVETRERGGTIYTLGNGGSAATASHMVCDLAKGCSEALGGAKFQVECLCDNTPILMAIANDYCYEDVFVRQLRDKLRPKDLVIAISGSGNSENVVRAVRYAREVGAPVIGVTGYSGGKVKQQADYTMHVDIDDMQIAEDVHMIFDHMTMRVIEMAGRGGYYLRRLAREWKASRCHKTLAQCLRAAACFPMLLAAVPADTGGGAAVEAAKPSAKTKAGAGSRLVKRSFDVVAAFLLTVICLIPMAVISLLIVCKDPGSPIYMHRRIGQDGKEIRVCKFRSMRNGADNLERMLTPEQLEEYKQEFKLRDDPRLLGYRKPGDGKRCFGALLRKLSLDELPQIPYNVLIKGNMSFVGPRPIMREELDKFYTREEQELFLSVKPGITGYWQTHGRSDCTYESGERQKLELYYAEHQGIGLDLKILLKTFGVVVHRGGTY